MWFLLFISIGAAVLFGLIAKAVEDEPVYLAFASIPCAGGIVMSLLVIWAYWGI